MENFQVEIDGVIIQVGEVISGISSSGNQWQKMSIVVKSAGKYPKEVEVSMYNELVGEFTEGQLVKLKCNLESRNHNGRYYTEVKAYKILN